MILIWIFVAMVIGLFVLALFEKPDPPRDLPEIRCVHGCRAAVCSICNPDPM